MTNAPRTFLEPTLRDYKARVLRVLVHIQAHLDGELGLEELAAIACFSPFHFHRVFRGMLGESVKEHVRRLRLERAASRLRLTEASVIDLALEAGYEAHAAFTRAFKAHFGLSPTAYRERHRAAAPRPVPSGVHYQTATRALRFRASRPSGRTMQVSLCQLPPQRVAFRRHVGPYDAVGQTWDLLCQALGAEGWLGGDTVMLGICHDDPDVTPAERLRYDACVTVGPEFQARADIGVQVIAGGDYAVYRHVGPYAGLSAAYSKLLGQWLPRSGRRLRATPCFEVYLNSPADTAPAELITDIHAPLE